MHPSVYFLQSHFMFETLLTPSKWSLMYFPNQIFCSYHSFQLPTLSFNIHNCLSSETPAPPSPCQPCPLHMFFPLPGWPHSVLFLWDLLFLQDLMRFLGNHPISSLLTLIQPAEWQRWVCSMPNAIPTHTSQFSPAPPDPLTLRAENMPLRHEGTRLATQYVCVGVNEKKGNVQKGQRGKEASEAFVSEITAQDPGWLRWLSVCLLLRSWSQGPRIEPRIRLAAQCRTCLSLSFRHSLWLCSLALPIK